MQVIDLGTKTATKKLGNHACWQQQVMFLYFKICNNILLLATERLLRALKVEIIILWVFNHINLCSLLTLLPLNTRLCRFLQRFRYLELKLNIVFSTQAEPLHLQMFVSSFNICIVVKLSPFPQQHTVTR